MNKNRKPERSIFDARELTVMDFVAEWHRTQIRKYTGEPYVNHLAAVAAIVKEYTGNSLIVAAAFCHDLYEDTSCPEKELLQLLKKAGFTQKETLGINAMVWDLTDKFVKTKYPELNRRTRKRQEAERLWNISPEAQNIKYADLIDNSIDLMQNDPKFGKRYLAEMEEILRNMNHGMPALYKKAKDTLKKLKKLEP